MAIAATANLALVVFDLTYIPWRNFWLQGNVPIPFTRLVIHLPMPQMTCDDRSVTPPVPRQQSVITCLYDPVKGIEPHRETQAYLDTVNKLKQQVDQLGLATAFQSPAVEATLADLRKQSADMITTNPFALAGKSGALERLKNRMKTHVGGGRSGIRSTAAFNQFWSTPYLSADNWRSQIAWFDQEIAPLIATNYYRSTSENGGFTNNFWVLDAPFVMLFGLEFLARTFYMSRRYTSLNWLDAMIWRWYDIPLWFPFSLFFPPLALSRLLPTLIRLHQAELINLGQILNQSRQGFVAAIGGEVAEVVVVQVVNQLQKSIRGGEFSDLLKHTTSRRYVSINNVNEIEAIAQHFTQLMIYQVFPKVQPDLEALVRNSIHGVLSQSPAYRGFQAIPGIGSVPAQITERLVSDVTQITYDSLKTVLEDPKTTELTTRLVQNLTNTLITEAQQQNNLEEIQVLLSDLLEEVKINYIQRLSEEDAHQILDQTRQIQLAMKE